MPSPQELRTDLGQQRANGARVGARRDLPCVIAMQLVHSRSAMWAIGSQEIARMSGVNRSRSVAPATVAITLACVSSTPSGGPVLSEV